MEGVQSCLGHFKTIAITKTSLEFLNAVNHHPINRGDCKIGIKPK
jgi:hypothetical protein